MSWAFWKLISYIVIPHFMIITWGSLKWLTCKRLLLILFCLDALGGVMLEDKLFEPRPCGKLPPRQQHRILSKNWDIQEKLRKISLEEWN